MSYIVLARKWRPQTFDDLVGQESVVKTIKNALSGEKVVHAYLFSGPRGVGKTSAARIFSKALNCSEGPAAEPCGRCRNCVSITGGSSVDVLEIDGASNTSVDNVRELRETVKYAPAAGKYKVYIIDEVHMLSTAAFNALLKTLEEPPPHVIFIFATTEPKKVPVTILSRCQHHSFRKIPKFMIKERITRISRDENIGITDTAVEMLARAADGSMRDALTLLDQASSFSSAISEKDLQTLLGLPESEIIFNLSDTILSGDMPRVLTLIKDLAERGYDFRPIIRELLEHFRNIAVVKLIQDPDDFLEFTGDETEKLKQQASLITMEELTMLLTEIFRLEAEVRNAVNPRYSLELGLLRASFIKGMTSFTDILKKIDGAADPGIPPAPSAKEPPPPGEVRDSQGGHSYTVWPEVIRQIKTLDHLLSYKLSAAKVVGISDTEFTIGLNGGMTVLRESIKKNAPLVEGTIRSITGKELRLNVISLPEEKKSIHSVKEKVLSDPFVRDALDLFKGKILEVKAIDNNGAAD